MRSTILALTLFVLSSAVAAQETNTPSVDNKSEPTVSSSPAPDTDTTVVQKVDPCPDPGQGNTCYEFPDKSERLKRYLNKAFGPTSYIGPAAGAAFQTFRGNPPEWEKNGKGFARRFASNVAENVIEESVVYAGSEVLGHDPKYYKSESKNFGKRVVHALKSGFTARDRRGRTVFAPQKVAAPFVSNVTSTTVWYPERYSAQDGLRQGGYSLLFSAGFNLLREFVF
ncbi:MAG: hypothetical protein DWQ47_10890 [Acidobacteria bacterium]|nr:MAG: hypothetical protein DWQ32_13305 [Acidobacteriota bacterium]REJ98089.1 MAG: hypothetical protein DWQ38_16105 [Acidobacteriota bacterium]REK16832.1 MAG: hypothetical protein DWQ43_01150 [Acidobacteriota bacterium]REK42743.1 MAG: hypothetical protein DWQ47_10890 [Acidobacteriota bacterium]